MNALFSTRYRQYLCCRSRCIVGDNTMMMLLLLLLLMMMIPIRRRRRRRIQLSTFAISMIITTTTRKCSTIDIGRHVLTPFLRRTES